MANNFSFPRCGARLLAALAGGVLCAQAQTATVLREVRFWSSVDTTRIAIETSQEVEFKDGLLENPHRLFVDLVDVVPRQSFKGLAYTIPVEDGLVKRIRVAPNQASITRVVLDLTGAVEFTTGKLVNPPRIVIDVRRISPGPLVPTPQIGAPPIVQISKQAPVEPALRPELTKAVAPPPPTPAPMPVAISPTVKGAGSLAAKPEPSSTVTSRMGSRSAQPAQLVTPSLTRALGLKLHRVALDAGHGGIDPGSDGPTGLVEKELALDITLRLGKLLEERAGMEVLYTRKDDSYVDLHERAPFANKARADLFLSIHANTAPVRNVVGTETYFLNRGESKEDLALATRENATSDRSLFELGDLVKKIVAYDKRDESRQFAASIQAATHELSTQTYGRLYNRGVRHSPLVVLIGATMPAVLVEVGFISNAKEEALLKRSEHRQKVAEALYRGIMNYSQTLSHFTLAQSED
jgi:N-acetylmuramoyl-L-alanine amidase